MWAWALLPICLTIWITVGVWIVYAMSVANGSVNIAEGFPYISVCGSYAPQSCVFAQVLNVAAFLGAWVSVLRFQQIRDYGCHSLLNSVSLFSGLLCAFGASLVGNFQQSIQFETHLTGAVLAFLVGNVYFWMQTVLTYQVKPRHGGSWIGPLRFLLSLACSAFCLMMVVFYTQNMISLSAICEWVLAMILFLLFGLFAVDFWHLDGMFFHVKKISISIPNEMQASTDNLQL